jgi:hypothetical protein
MTDLEQSESTMTSAKNPQRGCDEGQYPFENPLWRAETEVSIQ